MTDFNVHSDSIDVEQIMQRIRARIREKRGVDYTEEEVRELASVKLEKFLDPNLVRSDLIEHYQRRRPADPLPPLPSPPPHPDLYGFEADTIYESSRSASGRLIVFVRRLLNPILKLFWNPNPMIQVLHMQAAINEYYAKYAPPGVYGELMRIRQKLALRDDLDALNYEVLNNIVVELTRLGIEVKNVKMRLESFSSRLDFDERRARALEGVVQYRPTARAAPGETAAASTPGETPSGGQPDTPGPRSRRRRRRGRQRRPGGPVETPAGIGEGVVEGAAAEAAHPPAEPAEDSAVAPDPGGDREPGTSEP